MELILDYLLICIVSFLATYAFSLLPNYVRAGIFSGLFTYFLISIRLMSER